jgi:presenilin-like A22 family membrane protease
MNDPLRSLAIFVGTTLGAAALDQLASRQGAKLGLPHVAVGAIAVIADEAM